MSSSIEDDQAAAAYPMDQQGGYSHGKMKPGGYAAGTIASIQNDENGNPTWVLSGYWKASLTEGEKGNQSSPTSNSTSAMGQDKSNKVGKFGAWFDMVMTNGSAAHKHQIDNFTLTAISMPDNATTIYNGTVSITMKEGPVHDVPMSAIVKEGNVLSLWLDPFWKYPNIRNSHKGSTNNEVDGLAKPALLKSLPFFLRQSKCCD
jgi:hypothetical protein